MALTSISMNYPDRGKWGDNKYRGNCSGYVIRDLADHYIRSHKGIFVDTTLGGGTSKDVITSEFPEMAYLGLDLRYGFDYTKDSIREKLLKEIGSLADVCFSHPAYGSMIKYSSRMWGDKPHPRDVSYSNDNDFLEQSRFMLFNQRDATREGGVYCTLIGDRRAKGEFISYQADFIKMMPRNELKSVSIKMQHNCMSDGKKYATMKHPAILHEYLLIWEKSKQTLVQVCWDKAMEAKRDITHTWSSLVRFALMKLGGKEALSKIYDEVEKIAGDKLASNPTWKATVRRTLQQNFENVQRGVWSIQ